MEFYQPVSHAQAEKIDILGEKAVRLYCSYASPPHDEPGWKLQVRCPMGLKSGKVSSTYIVIASASLGVEEMKSLREAIDLELGKAGK